MIQLLFHSLSFLQELFNGNVFLVLKFILIIKYRITPSEPDMQDIDKVNKLLNKSHPSDFVEEFSVFQHLPTTQPPHNYLQFFIFSQNFHVSMVDLYSYQHFIKDILIQTRNTNNSLAPASKV